MRSKTLLIGKVRHFGKFSPYMLDDNKSIKLLISLFNGNLILDKRKAQLRNWLNVFNINEVNYKALPLINKAWISGFIDAEGCFSVTLFKRKAMTLGYQVKLRFMIDQKDSLHDILFIRDKLNLFLTHIKLKGEKANLSSMHRKNRKQFLH